jgi:hypothetical protein
MKTLTSKFKKLGKSPEAEGCPGLETLTPFQTTQANVFCPLPCSYEGGDVASHVDSILNESTTQQCKTFSN